MRQNLSTMSAYRKYIFNAIILLFLPYFVPAQGLPKLPKASEITTGTLSNGIEYYLVTNPSSHGYADYALVQRQQPDSAKAREALLSLPRFADQKPYLFLAGRGVAYPGDGFVKTGKYSTTYRFEDVPVTDVATSDSTLMMIFDLCARSDREQAIIISGDISPEELKGKMSIFSMMIPQLSPADSLPPYEWRPGQELRFRSRRNSTAGVAGIRLHYRLPRTPQDRLNTVQMYVNDLLYGSLQEILSRRLKEAFRMDDLPFANLAFDYSDSSRGEGDEGFTISVNVRASELGEALGIIGRTLASVDLLGVTEDELRAAQGAWISGLERTALYTTRSNRSYTDQCISAYLYGTPLSSLSHEAEYFKGKDLSSGKQTEVFCGVASAVLDPSHNLTLTCTTPQGDASARECVDAFQAGWAMASPALRYDFKQNIDADTLWHAFAAQRKVKLKGETPEPITGGEMLTFSNGLSVVYKQESGRKDFHYAMLIRGGYPYIKGLRSGEGAFVSDLLRLYDVGGVDSYDFVEMLRSEGVMMVREAGISDIRYYGTAPSDRLPLVLKSLVKICTDSRPFSEGYGYFRGCEALRLDVSHLEERGIRAAVDSIMRPEYIYSPYKYIENLSDDLQQKVGDYTDNRFANMGDGLLVIVGGVEKETLVRQLRELLGALNPSRSNVIRPRAQYVLRSGESTYQVRSATSEEQGVYLALSSVIPVTAERDMAFRVARLRLQRELAAVMAPLGYSVEVSGSEEIFPMERYLLMVSCRPVPESGLPAGVMAGRPEDVIQAVREVTARVSGEPCSAKELKILKGILLKDLAADLGRTSTRVDALLTRYSEGKEMSSRYKDALSGLTAAQELELMQALIGGSKVEYLVYE